MSEDTPASAAWSTNIAWSHDVDQVLGTHKVIFSDAIEVSEHARAHAVQHLKGKFFGRPMTGRTDYFTWHRENKFIDAL